MNKRILLKISGESLMGSSNYGIDVSTINKISNEIKNVYKKKYQICLIIGGGNIFRGIKGASEGIDRSTSDYMGMLATIMNALSRNFNIIYANCFQGQRNKGVGNVIKNSSEVPSMPRIIFSVSRRCSSVKSSITSPVLSSR